MNFYRLTSTQLYKLTLNELEELDIIYSTLQSNTVITVDSNDYISFNTTNGYWASIIILGEVFRIENDDGNFIWDSKGPDTTILNEDNLTITLPCKSSYYTVTWRGYSDNSHVFSVEFLYKNCKEKIIDASQITIFDEITTANLNPSDNWSDFNSWHYTWAIFKEFTENNEQTLCLRDLPNEPKIEEWI
jgi:hypothetical protein